MHVRWSAAPALAALSACSLLVSSEGYVGTSDAGADAAPSEASANGDDGGAQADVTDGSAGDGAVDSGKRCLSSEIVDGFERGTVEGNGWAVLANSATSQLEISQAEFVSATRSLRVAAKPVDSGIGSVVYMSRPVAGGCIDLTMRLRMVTAATDVTLLRIATLGSGNVPALRARLTGSSLVFVEESPDLGSRDLGSIPLGTNTWRTVHVHYDRAPGLTLAVDGTDVPLTNAPTAAFVETESVELGIARRVAASAGTLHIDDVVLR